MRDFIQGTFHFHSTYSHDGRSSLREIASVLSRRGFSFCVMTEHFEDFDAPKFECYLKEVNEVSQSSSFLLIPGVEVNLFGLDTILFPARDYAEIVELASRGKDDERRLFKVLAHPTKYSFEAVLQHLEKFQINGVELWNQQVDGSHLPPLEFLDLLKTQSWRNQLRYFFGCDLHNVNLTVANVISIPARSHGSVDGVVKALIDGDFVSRNLRTGIEYRNCFETNEYSTWLKTLRGRSYYRGKLLQGARYSLKSFYKRLPRDLQHSLNDVKNFIRNKV